MYIVSILVAFCQCGYMLRSQGVAWECHANVCKILSLETFLSSLVCHLLIGWSILIAYFLSGRSCGHPTYQPARQGHEGLSHEGILPTMKPNDMEVRHVYKAWKPCPKVSTIHSFPYTLTLIVNWAKRHDYHLSSDCASIWPLRRQILLEITDFKKPAD